MRQRLFVLATPGLLLAVCLGLAGCAHTVAKAPKPGPPNVTVSYPLHREVTDYEDFSGRTAAVDSVQVRARVTGYLEKAHFKEGTEVKEGEVLFEIDSRPYKAAAEQAQAQVQLQEAQLKYQKAVYRRNVQLSATSAISPEELQQSLAQRDTAEAQLKAARASLVQAKLNLAWTRVRAPITGRVSRKLVTRGNLIVADQTVLTTMASEDPMYAYFDVEEPTVLRIRQLIREGKLHPDVKKTIRIPVDLGLVTEQDYPHKGYVDFINIEFTPSTATLQVRGVFRNPKPPVGKRVLAPGMFVRTRLLIGPPYPALLVVQKAVMEDLSVTYLYVLDAENKVRRRNVTLGTKQEGLVVVARGLNPEDRVIVSGLQHVHPGVVVNPVIVPMPIPRPEEVTSAQALRVNPLPPAPAKRQPGKQVKR